MGSPEYLCVLPGRFSNRHGNLPVLLNVGMVVNVIFTVAVITVASAAVTEFQFRIGHIGSAAYAALVGIVFPGGSAFGSCLGEGDGAGVFHRPGFCLSAHADAPVEGNDIHNILAEEQEIVGNGDQREQIQREVTCQRKLNHIINCDAQIEQSQNPGSHRDNVKQQELRIGIQGGKTDQQAQIQIEDAGSSAEEHAEYIHQKHTGQIEKIEPECTPGIFHSPSQTEVTEKTQNHNQGVACAVGKYIGKQTPDLTPQDQFPVKAQYKIEGIAFVLEDKYATPLLDAIEVIDCVIKEIEDGK